MNLALRIALLWKKQQKAKKYTRAFNSLSESEEQKLDFRIYQQTEHLSSELGLCVTRGPLGLVILQKSS